MTASPKMPELLPCPTPWCKGDSVMEAPFNSAWAICRACNVVGPKSEWNKHRTPPPAPSTPASVWEMKG